MTATVKQLMERAQEELGAVRALSEIGYRSQATSRAYYAAEAALLQSGHRRSKHSGVLAAFSQIIVRGGEFDSDVSRVLRDLFDLRNTADYDIGAPLGVDLETTLARASAFVAAVAEWLAR